MAELAENDTGVLMFPLDEGDQVFGSLAARRFEGVWANWRMVSCLVPARPVAGWGGLLERSGVLGFDHAT
ncbi:MAG: hypothetical protein AAB177_05595 [Nitrospirota bacterium]